MNPSQGLANRPYARIELVVTVSGLGWVLLNASGPSGHYRFVGKVPAGADGWSYSVYQETEWEPATGVYCEAYYHGQRRSKLSALFGSYDQVQPSDFQAGQCGTVLYLRYLTYDTTMQLHALYDTHWRPGYYDSVRWQEPRRQQMQREKELRLRVRPCLNELHP